MTRKRYQKLVRGALTKCHIINKQYGHITYKAGKAIGNVRYYKLPEGMTYQKAWDGIARALDGIIS